MIKIVTMENAYLYGNILPLIFNLRYEQLVERQNWEVPFIRKMEYDHYDNPASVYCVHQENAGAVTGVARLYPTDRPYMIADVWPALIEEKELPSSETVWEGSRFVIDSRLPAQKRERIKQELVCSYMEFALENGIEEIIGVMSPLIWRYVFNRCGWPHIPMGEPKLLDSKEKILASSLPVSKDIHQNVKNKTGIFDSVLEDDPYDGSEKRTKAA